MVLHYALLAAQVLVGPAAPQARAPDPFCRTEGVQQLRIYEIFERNKAAFHARFDDHATQDHEAAWL